MGVEIIKDEATLHAWIDEAAVCHLALNHAEGPYVIPISFGRDGSTLYFHGGRRGMKFEAIGHDRRASFCIEHLDDIIRGETPCRWSMRFRSVAGHGHVRVVDDDDETVHGLDVITAHYSGELGNVLPPDKVSVTRVIALDIVRIEGRRH